MLLTSDHSNKVNNRTSCVGMKIHGKNDVSHRLFITVILLQPESDAVQAARADMFGILTRQVEEWHPHRILCKRFNVPDPYPGYVCISAIFF